MDELLTLTVEELRLLKYETVSKLIALKNFKRKIDDVIKKKLSKEV